MQLFNKTITLLNRCLENDFNDKFYITKINNVCCQINIASDNNSTDSSVSSKCSIFINEKTLPKKYLLPKQWLSLNDKSEFLTFKDDDYIVFGEISEKNIMDINEIYDKYDNVFKIFSYSYFDLLKSFQIKAL